MSECIIKASDICRDKDYKTADILDDVYQLIKSVNSEVSNG